MPGENNQNWSRTNTHFKDGYKNAQDSIRFIDTKTGVMTGLLMLTTAAPFAVFKWSAGLDAQNPFCFKVFTSHYPVSIQILTWGLMLGMVLGISGMVWAVEGLVARPPKKFYQGICGTIKRCWHKLFKNHKKKNDKPPITVLFPYFDPDDEETAKLHFHKAAKGLSEKEIDSEYEVQIIQVGRILSRKINCNKISVVIFQLQLLVYGLVGLLAFLFAQIL